MRRNLLDGTDVAEYDTVIKLKVVTKAPNKWKLIDMETGEEYIGQLPTEQDTHHWKKIDGVSDV